MASWCLRGTFSQPIEIQDSDEESKTLENASYIDLTLGDLEVSLEPQILQQPTHGNKDFSLLSGTDSHSQSSMQLGFVKRHLPALENPTKPFPSRDDGESYTLSNYPMRQVLQIDGNDFGGPNLGITVDNDTEDELSDVVDTSRRRRLRRIREGRSRTSNEFPYNALETIGAKVKKVSNESTYENYLSTKHVVINATQRTLSPLTLYIEEALSSVRHDMERDHGLVVKEQLQLALTRTRELQENLPDFSDVEDPFAGMRPMKITDTVTQVKDETNFANGEPNLTDSLIPKTPKRSPRYKHYITITRSFLVPDNKKLYFEPYLGQNVEESPTKTKLWLQQLREQYEPQEDSKASRQRELIARLTTYLPQILEKLHIDKQDLLSYIIDTGQIVLEPAVSSLAQTLLSFKKVFSIDMGDVFPEYQEHLEAAKKARRGPITAQELDPGKELLRPHMLSCPICHVYLCGIHGVYETDSSEDEDAERTAKDDNGYADLNMTYESVIHKHAEKSRQSKPVTDSIYNGKPCGPHCFSSRHTCHTILPEWTADEYNYFKTLFLGMENEPRAACILAPLMARPCHDIQRMILPLTRAPQKHTRTDARKSEELDWYDNIRKTIRVDLDWGRKTNTHLHDKIRQPTGCEHLGVSCFDAGDDCSCNTEQVLCDKFCACPDDCYMKFTGCSCSCSDSNTPCSQDSPSCPCVLLNRECDPDLCHDCLAAATVTPSVAHRGAAPVSSKRSSNWCRNTDIQRGIRKRLVVRESSHPANIGFGAYTDERVAAGAFIAEYVGEIISNAECGRRSEVYDKVKMSFIFDLNDEVVIDAYRYGNVERFINHSRKYANCKPVVKLVNGEHRIGFFALQDLEVGVELFFDYGREFVLKQGLKEMGDRPDQKGVASTKGKRAVKGTGGVLKHKFNGMDETVDVSEDYDAMLATMYGSLEEDEANEYEEEGSKSLIRPSSRPTRNVRRPKKYTL